jgi:hypothetical protein
MTASSTRRSQATSRKPNRSLPSPVLDAFHRAVEDGLEQLYNEPLQPRVADGDLQAALRRSITGCLIGCAYLILRHRFSVPDGYTVRKFVDEVYGESRFAELDIERICDCLQSAAGILDLQPVDLARLYQRILSFRPVPDATGNGAWTLQLDEKAKKDLGNFYTPPHLSRLAAEQALAPLVRRADGCINSPSRILDLRVADPAMGGGAFLCAALDYLTEMLQESIVVNKQQSTFPSPRLLVLTNCLHGVDLDPVAVEVCLLTLLLESRCDQNLSQISSSLRKQLKCGNSLIGCWRSQATTTKQEMDLFCASWFRRTSSEPRAMHGIAPANVGNGFQQSDPKVDATPNNRRGDAMRRPPQADFEPTGNNEFRHSDAELLEETHRLTRRLKFFHWELEFPHVFARQNPGFDAVIGNPPWEIHKPNSREFFQRLDSSYWHYGKQDALSRQEELCSTDPVVHRMWLDYQNEYLAFRKWVRYCGRAQTAGSEGSNRPFQYQGSADLNAYKLFLEASHYLLRNNGVLSFIVPSGIYSDLGARALRRLFLEQSRWLSIVGFENRAGLFDIHRSFKFCLIAVQKGGETDVLAAQFMLTDPSQVKEELVNPTRLAAATSDSGLTSYSRSLVKTFSPRALSIFEFEHQRDLQILEKVYAGSTRLDDGFAQIEFEREFDMTNDSKMFLPVEAIECQGFVADEYGHWLAGRWRAGSTNCSQSLDTIVSADRSRQIAIEDVRHVALPLYEGRMVGQFDFSQKGWVSGKSRRAVWSEIDNDGKSIRPQYVVMSENYSRWTESVPLKCGFLAVGSATNARSMIASAIDNFPCGNAVGILKVPNSQQALLLLACLNSYVFDFALRCRLAGNNLNYFVIAECPLPRLDWQSPSARLLVHAVARLNLSHPTFAQRWLDLFSPDVSASNVSTAPSVLSGSCEWERLWLRDHLERRRLRALLDASLAHLYGLTLEDLQWILRGCTELSKADRSPKGFWRGEKDFPLHHRQSTLTLNAYESICQSGIEFAFEQAAFATLNASFKADLQQHAMRKSRLVAHCSA